MPPLTAYALARGVKIFNSRLPQDELEIVTSRTQL
ncbi:hypothetical protein AWB76_07866 [Caballeronia temeraria]|uniref:Uncharacterized protein n=1 Tax=Caballeronia temeraria TaxID=1777137 RepID=A0A158E1F6_9BURK|nr:hypothetical protein AWB76_07866 [Caballeronia temeraria]